MDRKKLIEIIKSDHQGILDDAPEEGKQYALTGAPGNKCILNGDSWADSKVRNPEIMKTLNKELDRHY